MYKFEEKVLPVNSEVLVHLKNIESPVIMIQLYFSSSKFYFLLNFCFFRLMMLDLPFVLH